MVCTYTHTTAGHRNIIMGIKRLCKENEKKSNLEELASVTEVVQKRIA